jgi:uncharacterized protein
MDGFNHWVSIVMNVLLNPFHIFSSDGSRYFDLLDGSSDLVPAEQKSRLNDIRADKLKEVCRTDIPLIELGLIRTEEQLFREMEIVRSSIGDYLANAGGLSIMPTERCNFRCTYCYEKFEKGRISNDLVQSIKVFLEKEVPKFNSYSLGWFGGEPLLQPDIIRDVSLVLQNTAKKHNVMTSVAITTNGYLLDQALPKLVDVDISLFHISVDGPKAIHESQRRLQGGESYDKILDNIENVLETCKSKVLFRVNVDATNPVNCLEVSTWIVEEIQTRFSKYGKRLKLHVVPIWDASTKHVDGICLSETQHFQNWMIVESAIAKLGHQDLLSYLGNQIAGIGSLACYAGKPNHYVIGSDGRVYKCTVAFELEANQVGWMRSAGILELDNDKDSLWTSDSALTDSTCSQCAFSLSCMGLHCPLTRMETGKQPCPTQKRFITHYFDENS